MPEEAWMTNGSPLAGGTPNDSSPSMNTQEDRPSLLFFQHSVNRWHLTGRIVSENAQKGNTVRRLWEGSEGRRTLFE